MTETVAKAELLRSLGKLVRGLSALFWGLPIALVVCVQTAQTQMMHSFNILPPLLATGLIAYGVWQLGHFQRQERVWMTALDRAKILALINGGLSPFLFWWNQRPGQIFFLVIVTVLTISGLFFLRSLNLVLYRLTAMLPDEALRQETRHFTRLNRFLLLGILLLGVVFFVLTRYSSRLSFAVDFERFSGAGGIWLWFMVFLALLPLAMTMALLWKIKEVILESVFAAWLSK